MAYYVELPDTSTGPYGPIDLRRMAAHRLITPDTPVTTGDGRWISAIPPHIRHRRTAAALMELEH
jgi:hypothetical protein